MLTRQFHHDLVKQQRWGKTSLRVGIHKLGADVSVDDYGIFYGMKSMYSRA
ncbi:hypothetical protein [uncultured Mitsuokella sp.]|uniref:hypothetical protein n=1 Tax=uncultured Mitsuokella sp. TaxID=453120 RepID=UPI00266F1E3F|nr:hypothetical protein [uncultured Mitsuokella sp.]